MALASQEFRALQEALVDAFDFNHLKIMLKFGPGWNLDEIAAPGPLTSVVFNVIAYAEAHGAVPDLVRAALAANPENQKLKAFEANHPHLAREEAAAEGAIVEQPRYEFSGRP
jgi:hypothetical protein